MSYTSVVQNVTQIVEWALYSVFSGPGQQRDSIVRGQVVPGEGQTIVRVISLSIYSPGELLAPKKGQQIYVPVLQISLAFGIYFVL